LDELADEIRLAYLADVETVSWRSIPADFQARWRRVAKRVTELAVTSTAAGRMITREDLESVVATAAGALAGQPSQDARDAVQRLRAELQASYTLGRDVTWRAVGEDDA
jgi:hypothetical protein